MSLPSIKALLQPHISTASQIIVAFSGGLDSTVLLHAISQLYHTSDTPIIAIHINHNLSANAADWQTHCQQICHSLDIDFIAQSVLITANDKGLEAEARALRYAAIAQHIKPHAIVVTGQHQQDQLETFMLQLKRGAGPKGLSAMPHTAAFAHQSLLLRPLLNCSRDTLEQYAKTHDLSWIEDESNLDTRFDRNFLRHQVMPTLHQRWPGFDKAACRSIALIAEQQQLVDEIAAEDLNQVLSSTNVLVISALLSLSNVRQRHLLRYWIAQQGVEMPSQALLNAMLLEVIAAKQDANPKVKWAGHQLRRFHDSLYLLGNEIEHAGEDCLLVVNQTVTFDYGIGSLQLTDKIDVPVTNQLSLRPPREDEVVSVRFNVTGVSCKPQGSPHTRKLKQLFKQYQLPPWQRSRIPMIYYGDELVCVAGLFVCEDAKPALASVRCVLFT